MNIGSPLIVHLEHYWISIKSLCMCISHLSPLCSSSHMLHPMVEQVCTLTSNEWGIPQNFTIVDSMPIQYKSEPHSLIGQSDLFLCFR